ncbi:DIE2/ALG10 family protein [Tanacetum coccineum]
MQHPVDGRAWKKFHTKYPDFAKEPRNVRLGLAADGFNPFGNLSQAYNMWPVILTTYNLPPWLCMKESSFMLTLLIPGPKSPGKDIDVYLRPLIEDLKVLWDRKGVETIDVASGQKFNMRAMVLWTINDFPARSSLSGWSGQGYKACPTCNEDTPSVHVLSKTAYVGHRRFLKKPHKWRRSFEFNGQIDNTDPPKEFGRDVILAQLDILPTRVKGKHLSHGGVKIKLNVHVELNWTKRHRQGKTGLANVGHLKWLVARPNQKREMLEASGCIKVVDILCELEVIYLPALFDIMVYLVIHLPIEALEGWPIRPRWMYPFERYIKKLKGYVRNKAKPEGSIAEGYVAEEALKLKKVKWYVLHNSPEIDTYRSQFKSLFPNKDMQEEFLDWFGSQTRQRHVDNDQDPEVSTTSELFALANGPSWTPVSVNSCVVDGVRYVVHSRDERRTTQNSGICSPGPDGEMYYGQLQEIIEFKYLLFKVALFRVKWFDTSNKGRKVKKLVLRNNMTQIDCSCEAFKDDQYILMSSADVARSHGGDGGGDDRPPSHVVPTGCGSCFANKGKGKQKPNLGGRGASRPNTRDKTRNLSLKEISEAKGPVSISFEQGDKQTLNPLGPHAAHWSNYIGEVVRSVPLYYPSWEKVPKERKAAIISEIGTLFDLRPHMDSSRWTEIYEGINMHLQKAYNTNKASFKAKHWKADPTTGTYDVEAIRRARPEEITAAEWDKYIKFWNDPKNLARAAQNRLNRQKSVVTSRQGSRSLARLRDEMRQASDTQEYPSLIDTFWRTHTVDGVFPKDEDRRIYEEMKRLEATGEYTEDEINALARGGKLRGHIPGVGRVLPSRATSRPSMPAPDKSLKSMHRKVDFMMSLFRSDSKYSDMFKEFESGGASGSGECGDDEENDDDEDGDGDD